MVFQNIRWGIGTRVLVVLLISCLAATVIVWGATRSLRRNADQVKSDDAKTRSVEKLERLRQKYADVRSVHIAAKATIYLYGANARSGSGSYEYWADGERYRIKCSTDPHLELFSDTEFAYDGQRFYFLDRKTGILSYRQQDEPRSFAALPNPLFLPVDFLSRDDDDCVFCTPRLPEFKSKSARWSSRIEGIAIKSMGKDKTTANDITEVEMPGGIVEKIGFKLRMRVKESPDGSIRPTKIERVGLDGKSLTSITFDNFMQTAFGEFPLAIKMESFDESASPMLTIEYAIRVLEVDQPIDNSIFAIRFEEAEGVWDSDARRFIKEKPPKAKPR